MDQASSGHLPVATPGVPHVDGYHRPDDSELRRLDAGFERDDLQIRVPSLRRHRCMIALSVAGFAIGALLVVFASPWRNEVLAPGPLSSSHAQILRGLQGDRCAACHAAGSLSAAEWMAQAISGEGAGTADQCQSDLCMRCHSVTLGEADWQKAHNLPASELAAITQAKLERIQTRGRVIATLASHQLSGELACSTCHREHHGNGESLTALSNEQCQSCHVSRFHDFETGHPRFEIAAGDTGAMLQFDHASHGTKHFPGANQTFDCASCHPGDASGNVRTVASFERSCASCHERSIVDSQRTGWELLAIPVLDVAALRSAGIELDGGQLVHWPEAATGDFDGRLPPLMRLLLAGDEQLAAILERLPANFDFCSLDPARAEDLRTAAVLGGGIQRLTRELAEEGTVVINRRIACAAAGSARTGSELTMPPVPLLEQADQQQLADACRRWMPGLFVGEQGAGVKRADQVQKKTVTGLGGAPLFRFVQEPDDTLLAENPLKNRFPATPSTAGTKGSAAGAALPEYSSSSRTLEEIRQSESPPIAAQRSFAQEPYSPTTGQDDLNTGGQVTAFEPDRTGEVLAGNPLAGLRPTARPFVNNESSSRPAENAPSTNQSAETELAENLANRRPPGNAPPIRAADQSEKMPAASFFSAQAVPDGGPKRVVRQVSGDWTCDDRMLVFRYFPAGHADRLSAILLEWNHLISVKQHHSQAVQHFSAAFAATTGPGQCTQCHNLAGAKENPAAALSHASLWTARLRDPVQKNFTRFNHAPHTMLCDCHSCHALDQGEQGTVTGPRHQLAAWKKRSHTPMASGGDPAASRSGLIPLTPENCASCHRRGASPTDCTHCHNYHVTGTVNGH